MVRARDAYEILNEQSLDQRPRRTAESQAGNGQRHNPNGLADSPIM